MELEILSISIGIIGAILGVYFKENFRIAKKQKIILTKLRAYLEYDHRRNLVNNKSLTLIKTFNIDISLNVIHQYSRLNIVDKILIMVETKCKHTRENIVKSENYINYRKRVLNFYHQLKNKSGDFLYISTKDLKTMQEEIKNDVTFISDDEASQLNYNFTYIITHYKRYSLQLLDNYIKIVTYVENSDKLDFEILDSLFWEFLQNLSSLLNLFDLLLARTIKISEKNTTILAIKNIFS